MVIFFYHCFAIPGLKAHHSFHNIHAFFHFAKDYKLAIQPVSLEFKNKAKEEKLFQNHSSKIWVMIIKCN